MAKSLKRVYGERELFNGNKWYWRYRKGVGQELLHEQVVLTA